MGNRDWFFGIGKVKVAVSLWEWGKLGVGDGHGSVN